MFKFKIFQIQRRFHENRLLNVGSIYKNTTTPQTKMVLPQPNLNMRPEIHYF